MHFTIQRISEIVFRDISALGSAFFFWLLTFILFTLGFVREAFLSALFFVVVYLLVACIRLLYFKERPVKESHRTLFEKIDASSFPSVHAARAVFLALVLHTLFSRHLFFSVLLFAVALLICISRVVLRKHDVVDIIVGAVVGAVFFLLLF